MRHKLLPYLLFGTLLATLSACSSRRYAHPPKILPKGQTLMILDGELTAAKWDDGDTFSVKPANGGRKIRSRLKSYNTLESYGPVHQWGNWTAQELYGIAKQATTVARSQTWTCFSTNQSGGYGRIVSGCPTLKRKLLAEGLAHVFVIDREANPEDLKIQHQAIQAQKGMWAKGAPDFLITSLHSADEKRKKGNSYNRLCSSRTGAADVETHNDYYTLCQRVCVKGSCMTYIPFKKRYGRNRASCKQSIATTP